VLGQLVDGPVGVAVVDAVREQDVVGLGALEGRVINDLVGFADQLGLPGGLLVSGSVVYF
jgi:hypothetical protein